MGLIPASIFTQILLNSGGISDPTVIPIIVSGSITVTAEGTGGVIPEPSTILLLGTGLVGLAAWRLWRLEKR